MALAIIPILLIVVGILIYFATTRAQEVGRACFWAGFIGLAIGYSQHMIRIGS